MKNLIKGLIVFFSILLISLVLLMTYALVRGEDRLPMFGDLSDRFLERRLINTQTVVLDDISDIDINSYSCDVFFLKSDSEEMVIKEYTSNRSVKSSFITVRKDGSTLNIGAEKRSSHSWVVFGSNYRYIEVYLPGNYQDSINVDTTSGDVLVRTDLKLTNSSFVTSSGYVKLDELAAENISIRTSSGDIFVEKLSGEKKISSKSGFVSISGGDGSTKISTSSGDVMLEDIGGSIEINTSSGFVKGEQLTGPAKIRTSSGDVFLTLSELNGNLDIECSSGDVSCRLPEDAKFEFKAKTSSGEVITNFDRDLSFNRKGTQVHGTIGDSADTSVTIYTTSGDIKCSNR